MMGTGVRRGLIIAAAATFALSIGGASAQRRARTAPKTGELGLIGVRLYDSVQSVLDKYGNTAAVFGVFATENDLNNPGGAGMGTGGPPGLPGGAGMGKGGAPGPPGQLPSVGGGGGGEGGRGGPAFGGSAPGGFNPAQGDTGAGSSRQVMYVYVRKGITYTFIINDKGRVVQISSIATKDPRTVTKKGITLGSTYKDVIKRYGYPETHEFQGSTKILLKYLKTNHVAFQIFNAKVVGITVAAGTQ